MKRYTSDLSTLIMVAFGALISYALAGPMGLIGLGVVMYVMKK